jgi:ribonuclease J
VIPGNERAVQGLFDLISRQGPKVHHYKESEIHAGGHAREEDTKKMISLIQPQVYIPIYGFPHMLYGNARNAASLGYTPDRIALLRNGQIMEFTKDSHRITDGFIHRKLLTVDGRLVGYTGEKELHDRYQISQQGVLVISIAKKTAGFTLKYNTVGLPAIADIPGLEKELDSMLRNILIDILKYKDADALASFIERRATDLVLQQTGKEPKVVVVI